MKLIRIIKSSNQYRYHATTKGAVRNIAESGLIPNEGQYGTGVYFAPSEQEALDWTDDTTGGKVLLRVSLDNLKKFDYDEFPEQGWTSEAIPPQYIEIKSRNGNWIKIQEIF